METIDPIQQQLIDARRNQILEAATAVFAERGFHKATIRAIAQHAGIADGTIYNYFKNKTDLLIGILDRLN
ncbi:MAG: helix-turn-helix transcriptional regulator, partial [Anaerolineales bacterium]|nr:helix-turn-helix transcriptional regulator [Anaerolineales bacterium]